MADRAKKGARWMTRVGLALWLAGMTVLGAALLARHLLPLPAGPTAAERDFASLRRPSDGDDWLMVHVLYASCRCSERMADHLTSRTRPAHVVERVLLVGDSPDLSGRLVRAGFEVDLVCAEELETRYGVVAGPLLIITDTHRVLYSGGYTDRKQASSVKDVEILATLRAHVATAALPVYGCPISDRLTARLNPLGL
jgi:hypothetical protein